MTEILHALHLLLHTRFIQGGLAGWLVAAAVDWQAFRSWHSWEDVHRYDWRVASFRWVHGFLIGAVGAVGLKAVV